MPEPTNILPPVPSAHKASEPVVHTLADSPSGLTPETRDALADRIQASFDKVFGETPPVAITSTDAPTDGGVSQDEPQPVVDDTTVEDTPTAVAPEAATPPQEPVAVPGTGVPTLPESHKRSLIAYGWTEP